MWLISEHGTDSRDNGFIFFKYMRAKHREITCVYVCDRTQKKDWVRARKLGWVVQKNSFLHQLCYLLADCIVTSHVGDSEPPSAKRLGALHRRLFKSRQLTIFLQHGVTDKWMTGIYDKKSRPADLFITAAQREKQWVVDTLGYSPKEVALTGFARFDELNTKTPKRQILFIPRWRNELGFSSYGNRKRFRLQFIYSEYYKRCNEILNDEKLRQLLERYDCKLIFYPHYEMQPYIDEFSCDGPRIVIAGKDEYMLQRLLNTSDIMITDYSSVSFDFAYMRRPVIYYQFDRNRIINSIYKNSYFDFEKNGFGPIAEDRGSLINELEKFLENGLSNVPKYIARCEQFFPYQDRNNCSRIYNRIEQLRRERAEHG